MNHALHVAEPGWPYRGGGGPGVTAYTTRQPEVQEQRGGPRPPGSALFPDPRRGRVPSTPPQDSIPGPPPLSALTGAGRNAGEGSQSAGLRAAPSAPRSIPRSVSRGTSFAPPQGLRPAPPLRPASLARPAPILRVAETAG